MGHEYVNLGLSVMWATCNIGASTPQEYGDYFAWGETVPHYESGYAQEEPQTHWKSDMSGGYWWSTYKWSKETNSTLTKYCNDSNSGNEGLTDKMTKLVEDILSVARLESGAIKLNKEVVDASEFIQDCLQNEIV